MDTQTIEQSPILIIKRIDAIIAELQALRQQVATMQKAEEAPSAVDQVEQLYGSLGQGTKEEYDDMSDWRRFDE